jgi:hypothetical protein
VSTTVRPPRPVRVPDDLLAAMVSATGMAAHEILDVREHRQGWVVDLHDATSVIVLHEGEADALGQTGVLHFAGGRPGAHRGVRFYNDPQAPRAQQVAANEAWTLEDLAVAAGKLGSNLPAAEGGRHGPSRLGWVGSDPVRAFAVLKHYAERYDDNLRVAALSQPEANACRNIVLGSGWLSAREAERL